MVKTLNFLIIPPLLIFILAIFVGFLTYRVSWVNNDRHFAKLAKSFINGDLSLSPYNLPDGGYGDFKGKQYIFYGPLPSLILIPFIYIWGQDFPQELLPLASLALIYWAIFKLSRVFNFSQVDAFWLANFFVFGTVLYFVGLVNISAYLVQTVATAFLILPLWEYFTQRRWFVIGLLVAAAGATRVTLFGMSLFFVLEIWRRRSQIDLVKSLAYLMLPIIFTVSVLGIYNFRRFNSFFDTGYTYNASVRDKDNGNYKLGWFSPEHIPANLYALLIMPPEPVVKKGYQFVLEFPYLRVNHFGLAIWFTSPLFLYLVAVRKRLYTVPAVLTIVVLAIPSLVYFGIGISQYGYKYNLDFLPLLFLILLSAFPKGLTFRAKAIIAVGIIFNGFYMASIWGQYPLFSFWDYF